MKNQTKVTANYNGTQIEGVKITGPNKEVFYVKVSTPIDGKMWFFDTELTSIKEVV